MAALGGAGVIGEAVPHDEPWREIAACDGQAPAPFDDLTLEGRRTCAACPVRSDCLEAAMIEEGRTRASYRAGLRGGLSPADRVALQSFRDDVAKIAGTFERPARRSDRTPDRCLRCSDFARSAAASYCDPCAKAVARESTAARRAAAREAS